jgi:SAM-dependent methyltransferase
MAEASLSCPSCDRRGAARLGTVPLTKLFAGRIADTAALSGSLYRCDGCRLIFRWPRLSREETTRLYRSGDDGTLRYQEMNRQDWAIARRWLEESVPPQRSILDVGCFDGEFLSTLAGGWRRCGVEIDPLAAHRAEGRGVTMVARDIADLMAANPTERFGCVIAMDVIEHMEDPRSFLQQLVQMTLPGGTVIVSSGDADAWTWRFMGSRYWYCLFSDHISFINEPWCHAAAREQGLELLRLERFSHADRPDRRFFYMDLVKNVVYRTSPGLFAFLRRRGLGGVDLRTHPEMIGSPPLWRTARDHLIVGFRKKG